MLKIEGKKAIINGVKFTNVNPKTLKGQGIINRYDGKNRNLFACYDSPSGTKISIWNEWERWLDGITDAGYEGYMTVCSYSGWFFSIAGYANIDDNTVYFYITHADNYCCIV